MTAQRAEVVGIDLGGTNLRVALVDFAGRVRRETSEPTPPTREGVLDACVAAVAAVQLDGEAAPAVGMGVAGLVDRSGTVQYAPNLPQLVEVPLAADLAARLGVPVVADNDSNAAAWGELCHGAARGASHALVITLGTGVGGGIVVDGRLLRGAHGFAGEVGHIPFDPAGPRCACGEIGHWEAVASGGGLARLARARAEAGRAPGVLARAGGDAAAIEGTHVGDAAMAGDPDARELVARYAETVAEGLAGLVNVLDPELVVVSGGLVTLGDLLCEPLQEAFASRVEGARHRPPVPVVAAHLGTSSGVVGAAALARELVA